MDWLSTTVKHCMHACIAERDTATQTHTSCHTHSKFECGNSLKVRAYSFMCPHTKTILDRYKEVKVYARTEPACIKERHKTSP